ncbi:hypothetical protein 65p430 [Aeromonas phage 65]|uniref:Uncharacterized protein n=2 Tax=Ishigurovirus osborne TaxID=260149 RepID=A0A219YDJ8_9CAUD|nr:hypothetical protein ST65p430 [Aeromonas phage 65]ADQ53436.1 hypothetical protein 65p430 [Aeromonas phage 65]APU01793.1 hypothetical protein [Aeromonas phage 65.2]
MSRVKIIAKLKKIEELRSQIYELQSKCPHNEVVLKLGANTGNWDGDDSYWYDIVCEECLKSWREDQQTSNFSPYNDPRVVKVIR